VRQYQTAQFGAIDYEDDSVVEFPEGLPAFESETRFVLLDRAGTRPVIFLQSLSNPDLCFVTLPVALIDPGYRFHLPPGELKDLGIEGVPSLEDPALLCVAIVAMGERHTPAANLMAPVVVHLPSRRARQVIQRENVYSFEHPLGGGKEASC